MCALGICDQHCVNCRLYPCREETIDDSQVYKQQMAAMSGGAQMMDVNKAFAGERQALEMVRQPVHTCWRVVQKMQTALGALPRAR